MIWVNCHVYAAFSGTEGCSECHVGKSLREHLSVFNAAMSG